MTRNRLNFCRLTIPRLGAGGLAVVAAAWWVGAPRAGDPPAGSFVQVVRPVLSKYCTGCHGDAKQSGSLALDKADLKSIQNDRTTWETVVRRLRAGEMPPKGKPQPTAEEKATVVAWIEAELAKYVCTGPIDPGRVTLRRLNRAEYNNTIRDLLALDFQPADDFPADDVGYGFDNIGDVLAVSPLLLEKYLTAAEKIVDKAFADELPPIPPTKRWAAQELKVTQTDAPAQGRSKLLNAAGEFYVTFHFPKDGDYYIRYKAFGQQVGAERVKTAIRLDDKELQKDEIRATNAQMANEKETRKPVSAGEHRVAVAFLNPSRDPASTEPPKGERRLAVTEIEVQGPMLDKLHFRTEAYKRIMIAKAGPDLSERDAARRIVENLANKAFRRPVTPEETDRFVRLAELARGQGDDFEKGVQLAVQAILVSPHFLFKVEHERPLSDSALASGGGQGGAAYPISEYELATRLSYFLWSSLPDDELLGLADRGHLRTQLERQVRRMLKDAKVRALGENFAGQWLQLRNLPSAAPDPKLFPNFNEQLRSAMLRETTLFFNAMVAEDHDILDFLDADFTFVNDRLAKLYGIPGVSGAEFRRVSLKGTPRAGILTQASVLTVTSNPTRTSPVKRGKFILENLLNAPPPPPPPEVPELSNEPEAIASGSLRQRMELHRAKAECAVCHTKMDALGFALENFDAIGSWRTKDGSFPIDPSGTLPDGQSFKDAAQLRAILRENAGPFRRCLAEKMLTYALGRGVEEADRCAVDKICQQVVERKDRFAELVLAIVQSEPFQMRNPSPRASVPK